MSANATADLDRLLLLGRLVDQRLVDVRDHAAARDRGLDERVELLVAADGELEVARRDACLLYTSPSPRDRTRSRMPSSA